MWKVRKMGGGLTIFGTKEEVGFFQTLKLFHASLANIFIKCLKKAAENILDL